MAKRLSNTQQPVGIHSNESPKGLLLFGLPFVGIGVWISCIGLKVIEVDPSTVHAPDWLLTLVGVIFGFGGLMLWNMALQHSLKLRRIAKQTKRYPNNPAMADYVWDVIGYSPPRWKPILNAWIGVLLFSLFGSVLFWMTFEKSNGAWFLKAMSLLMALLLLWVVIYALKVTWHAFKYGKSTLLFSQCPIPLDSTVKLEIKLPMALHRANGATLALRCVEEFYETRGTGKNRRKSLVQEVKYEDTQELTPVDLAMWPRAIKAEFRLPDNAQPTKLHHERPRYWHVELKLDMPGLDFEQRYLLPIY